MRFNFDGDWKFLLIAGGVLIAVFLLAGALLSSVFSLFVWLLRGIGVLLGSLVGFAFRSVFNLIIAGGVIYLLYRGYVYLKNRKPDNANPDGVNYSDEDFEQREDNHEWK